MRATGAPGWTAGSANVTNATVNRLFIRVAAARTGAGSSRPRGNFLPVCIAFLFLAAGIPALSLAAEESEIEFPSPDGRFAFRETRGKDHTTLDLVEKASGKLVCHVLDSADYGPRLTGDVLWSPDSKRFALSSSEARLSSSISVFTSEGGTFRDVDLPDCADPKIPAKYENEERLHHWREIGFWDPVRWQKDGSLEIRGRTTRDGNENWVTSERTVILAPDKAGKWRIIRSKSRVASHFERTP